MYITASSPGVCRSLPLWGRDRRSSSIPLDIVRLHYVDDTVPYWVSFRGTIASTASPNALPTFSGSCCLAIHTYIDWAPVSCLSQDRQSQETFTLTDTINQYGRRKPHLAARSRSQAALLQPASLPFLQVQRLLLHGGSCYLLSSSSLASRRGPAEMHAAFHLDPLRGRRLCCHAFKQYVISTQY